MNDQNDLKQRASGILDTIDNLLRVAQKPDANTTFQGTKDVQDSQVETVKGANNNQASADLVNLKNEMASMKKTLTTLTVEVSSNQQAIKSLSGLVKQVSSLQATVNKLLSQSVAAQNPCDTPEGLSGEISGCP